jgi:1-acyl-sn-glycerol-3-phosphate acyltransferase
VNPVYGLATAASIATFGLNRWDVRVIGAHHIPTTGPMVLATNHVGYLDFVFVGYGARERGRRIRFVAKREVFDNPAVGPLMRAMDHIRVDRGGNTRVAMREVAAALAAGDAVGMFPEGTISRSYVPLAGRPGAARMAIDAGAPLVPGAVWGSQRIFTKGRSFRMAPRTAVRVAYGPPIETDPGDDPTEVHSRLMAAIGALVDDLQRTYPQRPAGPSDAWWQPAHLGGTAPTPEEAEARARADAERRRAAAGSTEPDAADVERRPAAGPPGDPDATDADRHG